MLTTDNKNVPWIIDTTHLQLWNVFLQQVKWGISSGQSPQHNGK